MAEQLLPTPDKAQVNVEGWKARFAAVDQKNRDAFDFLTSRVDRRDTAHAFAVRWAAVAEGWTKLAQRSWRTAPDHTLEIEEIAAAAARIGAEWRRRANDCPALGRAA